jgi:hypothetical protein
MYLKRGLKIGLIFLLLLLTTTLVVNAQPIDASAADFSTPVENFGAQDVNGDQKQLPEFEVLNYEHKVGPYMVDPFYSAYGGNFCDYLIDNKDNTRSIVADEFTEVKIVRYDASNQIISEKTVAYELSDFGAFYSGEKYNYIAFGQSNYEENDDKEVIRIVRYDKDFNRIDSVSIKGGECYTVNPFYYSGSRMSEKGDQLVLHTSRHRYTSDDGLNHQSQLTIILNTATMTVTNDLGPFQANHVSHSFDQYVQFDGDDHVLVDHGDAYPRAIVLQKGDGRSYQEKYLYDIPGRIGDNTTGVSVQGFEISSNNYIVLMNTNYSLNQTDTAAVATQGLLAPPRDIILCVLPRNFTGSTEVKKITIGKYLGTDKVASNPVLVKISDEQLMVLWQEFWFDKEGFLITGDLNYRLIDNNGEPITEIKTMPGYTLSNCQPILCGDAVTWCTNGISGVNWYSIPVVNQEKVNKVIDQINSLPEISKLSFADKAAVEKAHESYEALAQIGKELISQDLVAKLNNALVRIAELSFTSKTCIYQTHVQDIGWQGWKENSVISGTEGQSKRLEGIRISTNNIEGDVGVEYSTHVQNIGWQDFVKDGALSGTEGRSLRLEAIKISLTGADADKYDIYYQVHAENFGWLDWAKNGAEAGTAGLGLRLEAIRIVVVPKGSAAPGVTARPFIRN